MSADIDAIRTSLASLLAKWAVPPDEFIGKLPKPTKRDNAKGRCNECGGWHGLPAVHLDYLGHAEVTRALLESDPFWTWEPLAFDAAGLPAISITGGTASMWGRLTVWGVTRIGVGTADANKDDVLKELIGDFLRNAAMRFGVGLSLWSKAEWADVGHDDDAPAPPTTPDPVLPAGWESWEEYNAFRESLKERGHALGTAGQHEMAKWFNAQGFRWATLTGPQADAYAEFVASLEAAGTEPEQVPA